MSDNLYENEPVEIFEETMWIVHDPWLAQDVGVFTTKEAAELFAKTWQERG
jgi:hypothetical protein